MWAFVGQQAKGVEVRHLDGNPRNNTLSNLAYGTKSDNMQDAAKQGTIRFCHTKLTPTDVINIGADTRPISEIARSYGICQATVISIKKGVSFKGFTKEINYAPKKRVSLSEEDFNFVLDKNNSRSEITKKLGLSINQIKRIRRTKQNVIRV